MIKFQTIRNIGILIACIVVRSALATIIVQLPFDYQKTVTETSNNVWDITITQGAMGSGGPVFIFSDNANTDIINSLTVDDMSGSLFFIFNNQDSPGTKIKEIRQIRVFQATFQLSIMVTSGDLIGPLDPFSSIGTMDIGGNILTDVSATGDITTIQSGGNIFGNISSTGRVRTIIAASDIGSTVNPISVSFVEGQSMDGLQQMAGNSIHANINAPNAPVSSIETLAGDFSGSLACDRIVSAGGFSDFVIRGNLDADITVNNNLETMITTLNNGDLTGTITVDGTFSAPGAGIAIDGDLTSSASIAIDGDIDSPITVAGDILDNVTTPSISTTGSLLNDGTNSFGSIDVLGTKPGSNGDLSGEIFITGDLAGPIHLAGNLIATITPMASINIGGKVKAVSGMEGQILIDGGMFGDITIGSDVEGLTANDATRNIDILGNMQGFIDIGGSITQNADVAMDTIGYANTMQIGKSLDGHIFVEVDDVSGTNGLHGQIIVNADDLGNSWSSTGSVQVGVSPEFIVLSQPKYTITPNFLGGGAVGEVKIMLHDEASEPVNNGSGSNLESIILRFYGPVKSLTSSCPVLVERKNNQGQYIDVTSSMIFSFSPYDLTNGVFKTTLNLSQSGSGTITPGTYRISATSNLVGDFGTMPPVRPFGTDGYYNVIVN